MSVVLELKNQKNIRGLFPLEPPFGGGGFTASSPNPPAVLILDYPLLIATVCLKLSHCWLKCCSLSFSSAYVSICHAVIIHYLLHFHLLYFPHNWDWKQVNWDTNSFLPAPFEPQEKKKYLSVTPYSCVRNIHYIYIKYFNWNYALKPAPLPHENTPSPDRNECNQLLSQWLECFYEPVSLIHMQYTSALWESVQ